MAAGGFKNASNDATLLDALAERGGGPLFEGENLNDKLEDYPELETEFEITALLLKKARAALPVATVDGELGLQSLVTLAGKVKPQSAKSTKRATLYVARFVGVVGNKRPQDVTAQDAVKFRDAIADQSIANQAQQLGKLKALFGVAIDEALYRGINPFAGVKPRGTAKKLSEKKRAFTPAELKKFLTASKAVGGDFDLIMRLLTATGARSGEIAGLRCKDVRSVRGVAVIDINDENRPVKNMTSVRLVPLPSVLARELLSKAKKGQPDDWLFERVSDGAQGGLAHALQIQAGKILRAKVTSDTRLTLHCLRRTWRGVALDLEIDGSLSRAILGHGKGQDVHDEVYGKRPELKKLQPVVEAVAKELRIV
ncbi:MAG: tyrosine-type recombinase/integrase [Hyphomicrobium sp.]|nr:tyrosine-type recombinase/integrase [Hyphomicrobium sp.]